MPFEPLVRRVAVSEARDPLVVPLPDGLPTRAERAGFGSACSSASPRATTVAFHSVGGAMPKHTSAHEVSAKRGS